MSEYRYDASRVSPEAIQEWLESTMDSYRGYPPESPFTAELRRVLNEALMPDAPTIAELERELLSSIELKLEGALLCDTDTDIVKLSRDTFKEIREARAREAKEEDGE